MNVPMTTKLVARNSRMIGSTNTAASRSRRPRHNPTQTVAIKPMRTPARAAQRERHSRASVEVSRRRRRPATGEDLRRRQALAQENNDEDHRDHHVRATTGATTATGPSASPVRARRPRSRPGSERHATDHAGLERGPTTKEPMTTRRKPARRLHREACVRSDAAGANGRGVVAKPQTTAAPTPRESFQLDEELARACVRFRAPLSVMTSMPRGAPTDRRVVDARFDRHNVPARVALCGPRDRRCFMDLEANPWPVNDEAARRGSQFFFCPGASCRNRPPDDVLDELVTRVRHARAQRPIPAS